MSDEQLLKVLQEIARWTREAALPLARERLGRLLDSDPKKRLYDAMADGTRAKSALEKTSGVNHNEIKKLIQLWELEGIIERGANPPKAVFTLQELGMEPAARKTSRERK